MNEKAVFIIGSTGLIGQSCVDLFLQKNYAVYGFARSSNNIVGNAYEFHQIDLVNESVLFFDLMKKIEPVCIVFAAGNHGKLGNTKEDENLMYLHNSFAYQLILASKQQKTRISLLFCSSLMAYVPDRLFPHYAASKASLNQLIQSAQITNHEHSAVAGLVLGPVAKSPTKGFELSSEQVALKVYEMYQKKQHGLIFFPRYGQLIACIALFAPNWLEKLIFHKRKSHEES